jgi:hypothetical protein
MNPLRHLHRPSAPTAISLVALFFAMSGTAVAATSGGFILGKSNSASSVSSLTNTKGTALKLSSPPTAPPLQVSNSVQVPNLNASKLGGKSAFDYMAGGGQVSHVAGTTIFNNNIPLNLPVTPNNLYSLQIACTSSGEAQLTLTARTNINVWVTSADRDVLTFDSPSDGQRLIVLGTSGPQMITLQVSFLTFVITTEVSLMTNAPAHTCPYAAQAVSDG